MRVNPVTSPHAIAPQNTSQYSGQTAKDTRAAVVAKIEAIRSGQPQTSQEAAGLNPNQVSVEELSAVRPQTDRTERNVSPGVDTPAEVEATRSQPESKPEAKDPALQRQFEQLARQERQLRQKAKQQEESIRARQQELDAKEQAIKAKEVDYSQGYISKDQLRQETLRILAETGVDTQSLYNDLTEQTLNPLDVRTESHIKRLEAQIAKLEEKNSQNAKAYEEQQQQAYRAAVKQIETDVRNLVRNDPNYEVIKATGSVRDVVELIEETYKKDGVLMSVEEASDEVEKYLSEEATKLTRIGKIKRQLEQAGQPKSSEMKTQPTKEQPQMKTLTNAAASTRKLSAKERAIMAFKGELK